MNNKIMNDSFSKMLAKELRRDNKSFDAYMRMGYTYKIKSQNDTTKTTFVYIFNRNNEFEDAIEVSTKKIKQFVSFFNLLVC